MKTQTNLIKRLKSLKTKPLRLLFTQFILLFISSHLFAQQGQLIIYVKADSIPLQGVSVYYTCDWAANLGGWTSWNSGITDSNGQIITPVGENLSNVNVEVGNIPWALQQIYGNIAYPAQFTYQSLTQTDTIEFNLSPTIPEIQLIQPSSGNVILELGNSFSFEAEIEINQPHQIDSAIFEINGFKMQANNSSGNNYSSSSAWTPSANDFYQNHYLTIYAYGSNGSEKTLSHSFYLDCNGINCPNQAPVINWISPITTTINQPNGFAPVNIFIEIIDNDGFISSNQISINGVQDSLSFVSANQFSYSFVPTYFGNYSIIIEATDDDGEISSLQKNITISNSTFIPLPPKVIVGYWHSWDNASAPFMYLSEVDTSHFNVVVYSFIETLNGDGYTPQLTINTSAYQSAGTYDAQLLKDDIQHLQNQGIPVLVSIGGQNGHVELNTVAEKDTFVQGIINIVEEYGFDGIDMDFEGGSMDFGGGSLSDFSYSTISNGSYPKLKNVIDAFTEIDNYFGAGFHLTAAPELFYVQVGYSTYSNMAGSFLPIIDNLRNKIDYIHVQLYNSGSVNALDNIAYSTGNADFVVAMTDMLLKGFDVGTTGIHFSALNESQVAIGLPACPNAAPAGGYVLPADLIDALDYLTQGLSFGGSYNTQGAIYPNLRGAMTWSVNWDKAANCGAEWEFSNNVWNYFNTIPADTTPPVVSGQNLTIYLDSSGNSIITAQNVDNGSYDNSGISSMELSQYNFDCNDLGSNQVLFTVNDIYGNTANSQVNIDVIDTIAPTIIAQNYTASLINGFCQINVSDINLGSYDNCQIDSITLSQSTFSNPGVHLIVFTASDQSGNTASVAIEITVELSISSSQNTDILEFEIWPNPMRNYSFLRIQYEYKFDGITISNLYGETISQISYTTGIKNCYEFLQLQTGIYIVQIKQVNGHKISKKLIVL